MSNFGYLANHPEYVLFSKACIEAERVYATSPTTLTNAIFSSRPENKKCSGMPELGLLLCLKMSWPQ